MRPPEDDARIASGRSKSGGGRGRSMQALVGGAGRCGDLIGERLFWVALRYLRPELCSAFETVASVRPGIFLAVVGLSGRIWQSSI
jgi:hypothetical protein